MKTSCALRRGYPRFRCQMTRLCTSEIFSSVLALSVTGDLLGGK